MTAVGVFTSLALILPLSASSQQGPTALGVQAYGGFGNDPSGFDAGRDVAFDAGIRLGVGLTVRFSDYLSLRVDAATVSNSGTDRTLGAINEPVDFRRTYYSSALQISRPLASGFTPYLMVGGGMVRLQRDANEYWYGLSQFAALGGLGAAYPISEKLSVVAEGTGWIYERQTVGESQFDNAVTIGLKYNLAN